MLHDKADARFRASARRASACWDFAFASQVSVIACLAEARAKRELSFLRDR